MNGARCEYYTSLIAENSSNQWNLFRTTKSLLCEPSGVSFPKDIAPDDLANDFGNFFMQKIDKINQLIDMQSSRLKGLHIKSQHTDSLLQPIAKKQESHLKDTTDFINFIENMHILDDVALATLDVGSFYTNIPQTEGIDVICRHYEDQVMSIIYQFPQTTYGNFYGSYSKRILSSLMKDTSYKHMASPWELRQQFLSLLFLWQT